MRSLTPDDIRAARYALGMTHRQFGEALGVQEQTARRWEIASDKASNRQPSETVARLISVLLATNVTSRVTPTRKALESRDD